MLKKLVSLVSLVAAVAALQVAVGGVGAAQAKSQVELRKAFIGSWRLVSIEGGANPDRWGAMPTGLIYYDANGNMAAQIQPDRPRPTWTGAPTPQQALEAISGYTAYFGTYTIDEKAATVTHHRTGRLDGGAVDFVRAYVFAPGDRLVLTPVGGSGPPTHLTWERIKN